MKNISTTHRYPQIAGRILVALFVLALVAYSSGRIAVIQYQYDHPVDNAPTVYDLWAAINTQREQSGESDLLLSPGLTKSATAKCVDMVRNGYWDHYSPSGASWLSFIEQYDPNAAHQYTGENLSRGWQTTDQVVQGWMNSPEHKANILNTRFTNVGYAICTDAQSRVMVVQDFTSE